MYTIMNLPFDLVNSIFSFRPTHPVAVLVNNSINEFQQASPTKSLVFNDFFLHHLLHHKLQIYHAKVRVVFSEYKSFFESMREHQRINSNLTRRQKKYNDFIYSNYNNELRIIKDYASFSQDLHHSLLCCGLIDKDYFHSAIIRSAYNYDDFHNKYRDEIFNGQTTNNT